MTTRLVYSRAAISDLAALESWIASEQPKAAERMIEEIRNRCMLLAEFAEIGPLRPSWAATCASSPSSGA
ncbi:type II toxin-antitoxin system RelE/ParE family toxin [Zavarzinia sp. CC-PAN008]|uniref:type II toxin-antitoxin system RelE/ParE family toxin n=1 Tax=Zavarzinia sp. CC-PAN008 TaxID=3243332 RepID=UPI003F74A6DC